MKNAVNNIKNNEFWKDIKWLINYMSNVFMYSIIVILILVGIILLLYFIDIKKRENKAEWTAPLFGAYVIMSGSMEPTIMTRDAIIIRRIEDTSLKEGDIVTYRSEDPYFYGIMITHRIIGTDVVDGETVFITKGDNNATPDRLPIKRSQIYGKVFMVIPKIGYIQYFLATSYGWIIAVVIPCLGIIIYDIMKLIKNIKKNNRIFKRKEREIS